MHRDDQVNRNSVGQRCAHCEENPAERQTIRHLRHRRWSEATKSGPEPDTGICGQFSQSGP